jgi:hypothetical protein
MQDKVTIEQKCFNKAKGFNETKGAENKPNASISKDTPRLPNKLTFDLNSSHAKMNQRIIHTKGKI